MKTISVERQQKLADLYPWETETGKRLPMYSNRIVDIEEAGGIVDLTTGEIFYPKETQREPDIVS